MPRQIFLIQPTDVNTIFVKKNDKFVVHMKGNTEQVCKESRILNEYGRTHRVIQHHGNISVLSSLDTNKTKESVKL